MLELVHFFENARRVKRSKMMKLAIFACLCAIVLVEGQQIPMPPPPMGASVLEAVYNRVARQAPQGQMPGMPDMNGMNPGNLAMQGLGNIPDPTAVIAKAQEVGRQFLNGRRRRQAGPPSGPPSGPPPEGRPNGSHKRGN